MNEKIIYPNTYVVWDLETSGLDFKNDRILEIACLEIVNGEKVDSWSAILNHNIDIPEAASNIHHITKEKCAVEGIDPKIVMLKLIGTLLSYDCNITHNGVKFDIPFFLEQVVRDIKIGEYDLLEAALKKTSIDTAALFKAKKMNLLRYWDENLYDYSARVLSTRAFGVKFNIPIVCEELGIKTIKNLHRAGADVEVTHEIYKKLIQ